MDRRIQVRYSLAFKRQVVEDLESGRFGTILAAQEHYGIGGMCTVRGWLKRFGRNDLMAKVVRVEKPEEVDEMRRLRREIEQLRQALGQTQLENVLHETLLELACEQLGTDVECFKKKADRRRSVGRGGRDGR